MTNDKKKLPSLKSPTFTTDLPVKGTKVRYRGFTTKEQKILLIAKESEDVADALNAAEQIIANCIIEGVDDIDDMSIIDFTWLLIAIRSKSVNDKIVIVFKDDETEEEIKAAITLDNSLIVYPTDDTDYSTVEVDGHTIFLKQPGWRSFKRLLTEQENADLQFEVLVNSFDKMVAGDDVYDFSEFTEEEIVDFVESLPDSVPEHLKLFYASAPALRHEVKYVRPSDKKEKTFTIEGFDAFFT